MKEIWGVLKQRWLKLKLKLGNTRVKHRQKKKNLKSLLETWNWWNNLWMWIKPNSCFRARNSNGQREFWILLFPEENKNSIKVDVKHESERFLCHHLEVNRNMSKSGWTAFEFTEPYQINFSSSKMLSGMFKINPVKYSSLHHPGFGIMYLFFAKIAEIRVLPIGWHKKGIVLTLWKYVIIHFQMSILQGGVW